MSGQVLAEAWLFAFVLWSGLALGCLGLLMIGHLLGESWIHPVRDELEAGALTIPLAGLLGLPLLLALADLYPWAAAEPSAEIPPWRAAWLEPSFVLARSAGCFVLWTVLALVVVRRGEQPAISAIGLVLLTPTASLAGFDWILSREPAWWSGVFGLAFSVSQLLGALALAIIVDLLRPGGAPRPEHLRGLTKALLALALVALWLWFAQFLIVWSANLPDEVAWYLRRDDAWLIVNRGFALPALALGLALLIPPHAGRRRILASGALLLLYHLAHMAWLVRPPALIPALHWLDPLALLTFGLLLGWLFVHRLDRRPGAKAY
jgi:hypothetical protein